MSPKYPFISLIERPLGKKVDKITLKITVITFKIIVSRMDLIIICFTVSKLLHFVLALKLEAL